MSAGAIGPGWPLQLAAAVPPRSPRRRRRPRRMRPPHLPLPPSRYLTVTTDVGERVVVVVDDVANDLVRSGQRVRVAGDWLARPGNADFGQEQGQGQGSDGGAAAPSGNAQLSKCMSAKACMRARAVTLSSGHALPRQEPTCEPQRAAVTCAAAAPARAAGLAALATSREAPHPAPRLQAALPPPPPRRHVG